MTGQSRAAYMAGIMDGEGSFTVSKVKMPNKKGTSMTHNFVIYVGFTMTNPRVPRWALENFGGSVYIQNYSGAKSHRHWHRTAWRWRISTSKAHLERFLLAMIPYLIEKKPQAMLLLTFIRCPHGATERKTEILTEIQALNCRGKSPETNTPNAPLIGVKIESELLSDQKSAAVVIQ